MTVIIFLVDNTPSMLQQSMMTGVRNSYIDIAKQTVERFVELRASDEDRKHDRYMLLTYDDPPDHVKVGWNESSEQFENALKTLECTGSASERAALSNALALLDQDRIMVGIDTYGYGRCPFNNMFSFIVLVTNYHDFPKACDAAFLSISPTVAGSQLTKGPYRWDQRLFALTLGSSISSEYIEEMSREMGGWCMVIRSSKSWHQSISRLLSSLKFELRVDFVQETIQFTCIADTSVIKLESLNCAISCSKWKGSWPFPESYLPHLESKELEPRDAFPVVRILPVCCSEPVWMMKFPVDKYELRERMCGTNIVPAADQGKVWPVVIVSSTHRQEQPFGYLKKESGKTFFYVLAYNYPVLYRLIEENYPDLNAKNPQFITDMKNYISMIPPYYCFYLRKALSGILENPVLQLLLPNENIFYLNNPISNSLNQNRKDAKRNRMELCDYVSRQQGYPKAKQQETVQLIVEHPLLKRRKERTECAGGTIVVPTLERSTTPPDYRNLYAIDRKDLLDMTNRMRNAFYFPENISCCMNSSKHSRPISQMHDFATPQQSVTRLRTITDGDSKENMPISPTVRSNQEQPDLTPQNMKSL